MRDATAKANVETRPVCLTIAGFDPSCGAGITADLKTFAAHGVYGVAAITALTVQSTLGVRAVQPEQPALLGATLDCLAEDVTLAGVKIGMMATAALAGEVDRFLRSRRALRAVTVLDPVARSSSGAELLDAAGVALLRRQLLGVVDWITPNLAELALLTESEVRTVDDVPPAAAKLAALAAAAGNPALGIVVTGGHLDTPDDYVLRNGQGSWLKGERVETRATHGTGCAFSSALAARLAAGVEAGAAVQAAKQYVADAMRAAYPVGQGDGPLHHLFGLG